MAYGRKRIQELTGYPEGSGVAPGFPSLEAKGFVALPKRWVVDRAFAWLGRRRRLAKDWGASTARRSPSFA